MVLHLPTGLEHHPSTNSEGNVLFNDALNTFYLSLYGFGHLLKDHSDSERENYLPSFFYIHYSTDRMAHTIAFVIPVTEHWLE